MVAITRTWFRSSSGSVLATLALGACGDSSGPKDAFPDAEGVYEVTGTFDGIASSDAHFSGTLTLSQPTRAAGTLGGSAAYTATIGARTYDLSDDSLSGAFVSSDGAVTYTMGEASATWTFTGRLSGSSIMDGRHTLSEGSGSVSGDWSAIRATTASRALPAMRPAPKALTALARRLAH